MGVEDVEAGTTLIRAVTATHAAEGALMMVRASAFVQGVALCDILRDVFGNPFHPITLSTSWLSWNDGTVVRLAQAAYENRILPSGTPDNTRLAVLADALEEAGCADEQIWGHLRNGGDHHRGCFVLDALLSKS
jgi:hypothetical protein